MQIQLPYGRSHLTATIPDHFAVDVIEAPATPAAADPLQVVRSALDNLAGNAAWADLKHARSVAIAVNDKTRPVPHHHLLPPLMERIASLGVPDSAITFYLSVGTHPPMTPDEFPMSLPSDIIARYRVVSHDSENDALLVNLGETSGGTPVWVNKDYFRSDSKIVVGNIEPHQFVGFSGGVKTAAIGLAGFTTINKNHALMTHPLSQLAACDNNPARQDVEEIGQKIKIHLALNAILNQQKQIVHVLAGDPLAVMRAGIPRSRQVCQVGVSGAYDLLISSPGGHPKDINVYQSQKGLAHATLVARPGGTVILVAACSEGTGSPHYEDWMAGKDSHVEVLKAFHAGGFRIGPHKGFQIARDASKVRLLTCSDMDERLARAMLLNPVRDLQTAVDIALSTLKPGQRIGILPRAASTIPYLKTDAN